MTAYIRCITPVALSFLFPPSMTYCIVLALHLACRSWRTTPLDRPHSERCTAFSCPILLVSCAHTLFALHVMAHNSPLQATCTTPSA